MIKEGVVHAESTPCPVTGKACTCAQANGECELEQNKSAALKELGATLDAAI
jgi:hypothetical protein